MNVVELISRWKKRQLEIIETLPYDLRTEYEQLERSLRCVEATLSCLENSNGQIPKSRIQLSVRKKEVVKFLEENGPASRSQILRGLNIPNGSLGLVLSNESFEKSEDGKWKVKSKP